MKNPTEEEYRELRQRIAAADKFRSIPVTEWPDEYRWIGELVSIEEHIVVVRLIAFNRFLLDHTSICFVSIPQAKPVNPLKRMKDGTYYIRGSSMLGVNYELHLLRWPDTGEYTMNCEWREDIELTAITPLIREEDRKSSTGFMEGIGGLKANADGFVRLARELVKVEMTG